MIRGLLLRQVHGRNGLAVEGDVLIGVVVATGHASMTAGEQPPDAEGHDDRPGTTIVQPASAWRTGA